MRYERCPSGHQPPHETCEKKCEGDRPMMRLVVFLAIGVMGLILVRVRRQRKMRTAPAAE